MIKKCLCAVALVAALPTIAGEVDQFNYVSGGMLSSKHGYTSEFSKNVESDLGKLGFTKNQIKGMNSSATGMGFYLNGSVGFDNNVFVEGRVQNSQHINDYLLGVGYHYPVTQSVDIYGLVGVSKRHIQLATYKSQMLVQQTKSLLKSNRIDDGDNGEKRYTECTDQEKKDFIKGISEVSTTPYSYHGKFSPTAEVGIKAKITDDAGVDVAYRFAKFGDKKAFGDKVKTALHEGRVGGYHKIADNLAVEARYSYTAYLKDKVTDKFQKDHVGSLGLRYTF